jgi:hypothetical protein
MKTKSELQVYIDQVYQYLESAIQEAEAARQQHYPEDPTGAYGTAFELGYLRGMVRTATSLLSDVATKTQSEQ